MVKILDVMIKTIDDKGHVKTLCKDDIELDSIVIKKSDTQPVKREEKSAPKVEPEKPKETPKKKPIRQRKVNQET